MNTSKTVEAVMVASCVFLASSPNVTSQPVNRGYTKVNADDRSGVLNDPANVNRDITSISDTVSSAVADEVVFLPFTWREQPLIQSSDFFNSILAAIGSPDRASLSTRRMHATLDIDAPEEMLLRAARLLEIVPSEIQLPAVWADDGEIAFEWNWGDRHAILSIDDDGVVGYAMRDGDRFLPGQEIASLNAFPKELHVYLQAG